MLKLFLWWLSCPDADVAPLVLQAAAQEPASAAEGKGEEDAEAAGQQQGDQAQVGLPLPCQQPSLAPHTL